MKAFLKLCLLLSIWMGWTSALYMVCRIILPEVGMSHPSIIHVAASLLVIGGAVFFSALIQDLYKMIQ